MTHTPGAWVTGGPYPTVSVCTIDSDGEWFPITILWDWNDHKRNGEAPEEVKANARLIAAAPDLLAACKAFIEATFIDLDSVFTPSDKLVKAHVLARAAIAKAEGG